MASDEETQPTGAQTASEARAEPGLETRPAARALGEPVEFETWLDEALTAELAVVARRGGGAGGGAGPGIVIGLITALLAAGVAFWFEVVSRWVALDEAGLGALALEPTGRPFLPVLTLALSFLALGFIGRWAEQSLSAAAQRRAQMRRELLGRGTARLRLEADGARLIGDGFEATYRWRLIESVAEERFAVWLVIGAGGLPIPRSTIGGPAEVEGLLGRIEEFREEASAREHA